jgi:hypothetical protein
MKKSNNIIPAVFIIVIAVLIIALLKTTFRNNPNSYQNLDQFAKCLTEKNVVMYGNWWCGACQKQEELFGKSFKSIKYVECSKNTTECLNKNIEATPTWIFQSGERIIGLTPLEVLAQKADCQLK